MHFKVKASIDRKNFIANPTNTKSVEATRNDLKWLSEELVVQAARLSEGEEVFKNEEGFYNESNRQYNEFNLLSNKAAK